jgi:hypothetical protein
MIENITREDVEIVMQDAINAYNSSTDQNEYRFNVWIEDELVDVMTMPSYLAPIYRNSPVFVEVTGNPIFN